MSEASDGLAVSGGVGGLAVNLADLSTLAAVLDDAGRAVLDAASVVRGVAARLAVSAGLAPASGGRAVEAVLGAAAVLEAVAQGIAARAAAVRAARSGYAEAERRTVQAVAESGRRAAGLLLPRAVADVLPFPGSPGLLRPEPALRAFGWASVAWVPAGPGVRVAQLGVPRPLPAPPRGAAGIVAGIATLSPAEAGATGAIAVDRIDRPDGHRSWAVLIPGTQSLAIGGRNPMDDATNVQAFTGAPSAVGSAVLVALARAGARPDEPVLLAGHSQGGIVAMRLAADPAVRRRHRVTGVLTAGSPVGHLPSPAGVRTLHLEHAGDVVPMLDGTRNPDEADRVTVRATGPPGTTGLGGLAAAHAANGYRGTAALADASTHPSLDDWRRGAQEVLGGAGATATRTVYVAERHPVPGPSAADPARASDPQE